MMTKTIVGIISIIIIIIIGVVSIFFFLPETTITPECGDGICDSEYETWENCPDDCGCNDNGICESDRGETASNCADCVDPVCNNDGICDESAGETWENCPDCRQPGCNNDGICDEGYETRYDCVDCVTRQAESTDTGFGLPNTDKRVGDIFWVTVYVTPPEDIYGFGIDIEFDNSILELIDQEGIGDFDSFFYPGTETNGVISQVQSFSTTPLENKGNLFRLKFKAIATGTSNLDFTSSLFTGYEVTTVDIGTTDNYIEIS